MRGRLACAKALPTRRPRRSCCGAGQKLCRQAQQQDTYRVQALLAGYEKDRKDSAAAAAAAGDGQAASAALRRPGLPAFSPIPQRGLRAAEAARRADEANACATRDWSDRVRHGNGCQVGQVPRNDTPIGR